MKWKVMQRNVWSDIANWQTKLNEEELGVVGVMSQVCSQIVLKCLYLARVGRLDILWSVNELARSITKWTKACDKRLNRLILYIHHTCQYKQYCHVGNTAKQCSRGLFQDRDFAGHFEDSKSTSGGTLCVSGSHTLVPISWMCKKQTAVSHSSTESEIISLDTGLRLDGIPAVDLWDLIVLKCLYLARIGRPDILWSVNKLARFATRWTQACDRRLARLISCIHHTSDYRQYCHVGNAAQHC